MISNEGLQVALSPVQLAAVMSDSTVTEGETWGNRLMGGRGLAGGVVG
ncbi:RNase A-like domain-containing protein, partial [Serratia sp. IR-2025]